MRKTRSRPRRGPERCPDYLAWIRTLGCAVCSRLSGESTVIEAAHTNALGPRGMAQKASDFSAIPLCSAHHRQGLDSYHRLGEERFACEHRLNLPELVLALNSRFRRQDVHGSPLRHTDRPRSDQDAQSHAGRPAAVLVISETELTP